MRGEVKMIRIIFEWKHQLTRISFCVVTLIADIDVC